MLKLMLQKLTHKKWMVLCLLIGNILLIAVATSHPMYKEASFKKMLQNEFANYETTNKANPGLVSLSLTIKKDRGELLHNFEAFFNSIPGKIGATKYQSMKHYSLVVSTAQSQMERDDSELLKLKAGFLSSLSEHAQITSGSMFSQEVSSDGCVEAVVSEAGMIEMNLLLGEVLEFPNLKNTAGEPVLIKIVGVFQENVTTDPYWVESSDSFLNECFISEDIFTSYFLGDQSKNYNIRCNANLFIDYQSFSPDQVSNIAAVSDTLLHSKPFGSTITTMNYTDVLQSYADKSSRIEDTLFILQVPVFVLLCAFLFMISGQMLSMEQNEISLMKSRGAKRMQIILLYVWQSLILSLVSVIPGIPLGILICNILGSSNAFLEFVQREPLQIVVSGSVLLYAFLAILVCVVITVIPVIGHSRVSIVNLKQKNARSQRSFWEKTGLDLIAIGISLYGYYSFAKKSKQLSQALLANESLDPLLYFSSSLFILGFGLLFLRIRPILIRLVYLPGKSFWKPASYASFLQTLRTGRKQQFIMLFLILTVALGIFHATVARTIIANGEANVSYIDGTDLIVSEKWKDNRGLTAVDPTIAFTYYEPDFGKFSQIPNVTATTKVIYDSNVFLSTTGTKRPTITVMGIHTKEFGAMTSLPEGLLPYDYYQYLNVLAQDPNGILVSTSLKNTYDYRLGDTITFTNSDDISVAGTIYGFFDYFPSYVPSIYALQADGTYADTPNNLVIANLSLLQEKWGTYPYQVWMNVDGSTGPFYDWVETNDVTLLSYTDQSKDLLAIRNDTLFQGTNGILTMSFIIILILCGVGYLIYWIMSIRSRELLFGILRAMGMGKREIVHMLILEQFFSGILSLVAGFFIGIWASRLYVPIIQNAYAATNQILPLTLITDSADLIKLFAVTGSVLLLCFFVIAHIVRKMKITNALKLGED